MALHVSQCVDTCLPFARREARCIGVIVVIAQDAYHAVCRMHRFQHIGQWLQLVEIKGHQVTGEDDEVGMQVVDTLYCTL